MRRGVVTKLNRSQRRKQREGTKMNGDVESTVREGLVIWEGGWDASRRGAERAEEKRKTERLDSQPERIGAARLEDI
jgi:hypothetical protein